LTASQKPTLGFANPVLYSIGTGSAYASTFHDVTTGNNLYYHAGVGYDNASGWGSFNGADLFATLTNSTPPTPPPVQSPELNVSLKHNAPFTTGGIGTYYITVANQGNGSTSAPVHVVVSLPPGLSYKSFTGSGWNFNQSTLTFSQTTSLAPNATYPIITLNVHVVAQKPTSVTTSATVSGGGSASSSASDYTTIK
jgi:uncharacterized repeat protein (TIGR01451 family)